MKKLKDLKPCIYESRVEAYGTLRKHWEDASAKDLMWLLTHPKSTIPRRRLVGITLKTLIVCEQVTPEASKTCLLDLQRWVDGEEVDLKAVYAAAYAAAYAAGAAAEAAYYAAEAVYAAARAAYAARVAAARGAADDAYTAAAYAARVAAASQKQAEIIREAISFEEACSYLDLDPEEVLS